MMKSMLLQYSHILVKEHFLGSLPHVENIQQRWASNAMYPPCSVIGPSPGVSAQTHAKEHPAHRLWHPLDHFRAAS